MDWYTVEIDRMQKALDKHAATSASATAATASASAAAPTKPKAKRKATKTKKDKHAKFFAHIDPATIVANDKRVMDALRVMDELRKVFDESPRVKRRRVSNQS